MLTYIGYAGMTFRIGSRQLCWPNCSGPCLIVKQKMQAQKRIQKNDLKAMDINSISIFRQIFDDLNYPTIHQKVNLSLHPSKIFNQKLNQCFMCQ
jgi:hypothetical protein